MEVQTANNGELLSGGSVLENAGTLTLDDNADLQPGDSNTADKVVNDAGATISYSGSSCLGRRGYRPSPHRHRHHQRHGRNPVR